MVFFVWAAKGGSGATVTSVALASTLARSSGQDVLLVDFAGDLPAAIGIAEPRHGLTDWLSAPGAPPVEALGRLEVSRSGLSILARGEAVEWSASRERELIGFLMTTQRLVVIDGGVVRASPVSALDRLASASLDASDRSVLVARSCYLGLRRAIACGRRTDCVVLVREPGRVMGAADVRAVLTVEHIVEVDLDPLLARSVDSGLLADRGYRLLSRSLRRVA